MIATQTPFLQGAVSNTALKFPELDKPLDLQVSIDWLQGTGTIPTDSSFESFLAFVGDVLGEVWTLDFDKPFNPGKKFNHSGRTCNGCRVAWSVLLDESFGTQKCEYWLSIPGSVLGSLPLHSDSTASISHLLATIVTCYNFKATRIDVSLDDYSKLISPNDVARIVREPRISESDSSGLPGSMRHITGVHDCRIIESHSLNKPGTTVYFGGMKGEKMLRFYDKASESLGVTDCYRWELQLRGHKAKVLAQDSARVGMEISEELPRFLAAYVIGSVDFVEFHYKNLERCTRLPFWQHFHDAIQLSLKIPCPKKEHSITKKLAWVEKSVSKTLAIFHEVFGRAGTRIRLDRFIESAVKRFKSEDYNLISSSLMHHDELRRCSIAY